MRFASDKKKDKKTRDFFVDKRKERRQKKTTERKENSKTHTALQTYSLHKPKTLKTKLIDKREVK